MTPLSDTDITRLLDRLAGTVPDQAAPVVPLLQAAQLARRRRRTILATVASVMAVLLVASGLALAQRGSTPPTDAAVAPRAAPGMRLIGVGDLVVEVPASWARFAPSCGRPPVAYIHFLPVPALGCIPSPEDPPLPGPALGIGDTNAVWSGLPDGGWITRISQAGVETQRFETCQANETHARCVLLVKVEDDGTGFAIEWDGNDGDQRLVGEAIADSVRRLPDGWTTVPYVDMYRGGRTADEAVGVLEGAGFEVAEPRPGGRVAATQPLAGTVVEEGSTVSLLGPRETLAACTVTLSRDGTTQTLHLVGERPPVQFERPGQVRVTIGDGCPWDLGVASVVVSGRGARYSDGTTSSLDLGADATHVALLYQPCASTAPGCRGPSSRMLFPIAGDSPAPLPDPDDGDVQVSCGDGAGWPASVMANGVDGLLSDAEVTTAFREMLSDRQAAVELRSFLPDGPAGTEFRVLALAGDEYTVGLGHWTDQGPAQNGQIITMQRTSAGWRWTGGRGTCRLAPVLPPGQQWVDVAEPEDGLDRATRTLTVVLTEHQCASGRDPLPYLREPVVHESSDQVLVQWTSDSPTGGGNCISNPSVDHTLTLTEPLGDRTLLDGSVYPPRPIGPPAS